MSLAEFLDLPCQEQRCELIDGVVCTAAFPIPDRQFLAMILSGYMFQQIMETGLGIVYQVAGVVVSDNSALGPDIVVVLTERVGIIGPTVIDGGPPDIVVEVLPSNRHTDLVRKREFTRRLASRNTGSWTATPTHSRRWRWATTERTRSVRC